MLSYQQDQVITVTYPEAGKFIAVFSRVKVLRHRLLFQRLARALSPPRQNAAATLHVLDGDVKRGITHG